MSGWEAHGDKCFYFSTDTVPKFDDGVAKCKALSPVATLASVASQEELEWVLGEFRRWQIWIGIFDPLEHSMVKGTLKTPNPKTPNPKCRLYWYLTTPNKYEQTFRYTNSSSTVYAL
jgi:hypothetical protein